MSSRHAMRHTRRRVLQLVPILLGVSVMVFLLVHLIPGDPARTLLGAQARPESIAALRNRLGLNAGLPSQYVSYLKDLLSGNLGTSLAYHRPLTELIGDRWAPTLWMVVYATLLVVVITVPLALVAARRPGGAVDGLVRTVALIGLGMPSVWLGLLLILLLGTRLHLFPVSGYGHGLFGHLHAMFLPAFTVALSMAPTTIRSLRTSLVEMFESDHLVAVRAKGLPDHVVVMRYALRVAVLPVITVLGVNLGWLVGNTVVIEQIFVIPGLGSLMVGAISNRDFPVVQTLALVFAGVVIVISLLTDLARSSLDPRVELA